MGVFIDPKFRNILKKSTNKKMLLNKPLACFEATNQVLTFN